MVFRTIDWYKGN